MSHVLEQQSPLTVQAPASGTHDGAHEPEVRPGGTSQTSPAQQSPVTVQLCAIIRQAARVSHTPPPHPPPQHCHADVQLSPFGRHVTGVQRSTPSASGVHGASAQHWSLNWQKSPGWMHMTVGCGAQRCRSHTPEQHSPPVEHRSPSTTHAAGAMQYPSAVACGW
jgi:hypothetical protein